MFSFWVTNSLNDPAFTENHAKGSPCVCTKTVQVFSRVLCGEACCWCTAQQNMISPLPFNDAVANVRSCWPQFRCKPRHSTVIQHLYSLTFFAAVCPNRTILFESRSLAHMRSLGGGML